MLQSSISSIQQDDELYPKFFIFIYNSKYYFLDQVDFIPIQRMLQKIMKKISKRIIFGEDISLIIFGEDI